DADTGLTYAVIKNQSSGAPGTSLRFGSTFTLRLNGNGEAAIHIRLTNSAGNVGINTAAIYTGAAGDQSQLSLVMVERTQAPALPAGVDYGGNGTQAGVLGFNDAGEVIFHNILTGTGVTTSNRQAIFAGAAGNVQLVARQGDAAPGAASTFSALNNGQQTIN